MYNESFGDLYFCIFLPFFPAAAVINASRQSESMRDTLKTQKLMLLGLFPFLPSSFSHIE
jgi:hypothetical protein